MKRLLSLKKLLVMLTFLLCGFCQTENAQAEPTPVRVSDLGVERFADKFNYYLSQAGKSERIFLLKSFDDFWIGNIKDERKDGFELYIWFSVNKEGYVYDVRIVANRFISSSASSVSVGNVLGSCLLTIGLTKNEGVNLMEQLQNKLVEIKGSTSGISEATIWGSNINRYVFLEAMACGYDNEDAMIHIKGYK